MKKVTKTMTFTFLFNFVIAIIEIAIGLISKSAAVMVDGFNTLADSITDIVAIIGSKWSNKRANKKYPFGYGQIEYVTNVVIGFIIIGLGVYLVSNSAQEQIIIPSILLVLVPLVKIVLKLILYKYISDMGHEYQNSILLSSSKETLLDITGSFLVLIAIILMQFDVIYADRIVAALVSILIIKTGFEFISENISHLIGEQENDTELLEEIKQIMLDEKRILSIEKLIVIKSGPYYKVDAEVVMEGNLTLRVVHRTIEKVTKELKKVKKLKYIKIIADPKIN